MFKNLTPLCSKCFCWNSSRAKINEALEKYRFTPCTSSQSQSIGWVEPRCISYAPLAEFVGGEYVLCLMIENKSIPAEVLKRKIQERCEQIEKETGRRPGRKYQRELREQILFELLPSAFSKQTRINVWLNKKNEWVIVESSSASQVRIVSTMLMKTFEGMSIHALESNRSLPYFLADFLLNGAPAGFSVDMDCVLEDSNHQHPIVRYTRCNLDCEEVHRYIRQGMMPTQLALTWRDRVSFVLAGNLAIQLKRIQWLDMALAESEANEHEGAFDADVALATGQLLPLLESLVLALEVQR